MPSVIVENFRQGLDARNLPHTTLPGSLLVAENCVINQGGEIEKTKSWKQHRNLPAGTFGLATIGTQEYVFGSDPEPAGMPQKVNYQRLEYNSEDLIDVIDYDLFDGKLYVVAQYSSGDIVHFYDGNQVTDWVDGRASGSVTLDAGSAGNIRIFVDGVEVTSAAVPFNTDLTQTALDVAADINTFNSTPDYIATANGTEIIVRAATAGTASNGLPLSFVAGAGLSATVTSSPLSGGQDLAPGEQFVPGTFVRTIGTKMYALSGSVLHYSDIDNPTSWQPGSNKGAGFINLSNHSAGSEELVAIGQYANRYAIFSKTNIQIWNLDEDEENNFLIQLITNSASVSPQGVQEFSNDLMYPDRSGIRSLRARDSSNTANVADVGTAIDPIIQNLIVNNRADIADSKGVIEPLNGRYMLSVGDTIYVFSLFPESKVSAWTTIKPGFTVDYFAQSGLTVLARSGDTIYQFGGPLDSTYDDSEAVIRMPYLDPLEKPRRHRCSLNW